MTANDTSSEKAFFSDIADKLESAAANLDSGSPPSIESSGGQGNRYLSANFASKLAYTACYTLSYGVCFPVFMVCHYIPKNNRFVEGLVDGEASANASVENLLERIKSNRLARQQSAEQKRELEEVVESGAGALEPA